MGKKDKMAPKVKADRPSGKGKSGKTSASGHRSGALSESDLYHPSPFLDDLANHPEGRPTKLDRKFYEK